jgi:8-amino-7-oxononanoate synthase
LDFTSNDYLGFADSPELRAAASEALSRQVPVGAGGSRLLRGNHPEHEALEQAAAAYFGAESALYFAAVTRAALALCEASDPRRERLQGLVACASHALAQHCGLTSSGSHILPIVIGEDQAAVDLAAKLRGYGYDVRAIRPPTVPAGTARLRIALTLNVDEPAVESLFQAFGREMNQ